MLHDHSVNHCFFNSLSVYCMDCKLNFDENASYRQPDIFKLRDWTQEDPREKIASESDLNYIGLDGSIGCMGNNLSLSLLSHSC